MPDDRRPGPGATEAAAASAACCVILNAGSGAGETDARREALKAAFDRHPGRFELREVGRGAQIAAEAERALSEGFGVIAAAGGDGTIAAVASVLAGSGAIMGVVPLGTFNYFARTLELPLEIDGAVNVLASGTVRDCDVGEVNGRVFLNNASLGAYAAILEQREGIYRRWGRSRLAAYWSVLVTLARIRRPMTLKVSVDGEVLRFRTPIAFVANNAHQLERFDLAGGACIRSGRFALFIAPDCGRIDLIRYALRLATRSMEAERDFELLCGREIDVETWHGRRLVARDGERERMTGPFRFRRRPGALRVLVPAGGGQG